MLFNTSLYNQQIYNNATTIIVNLLFDSKRRVSTSTQKSIDTYRVVHNNVSEGYDIARKVIKSDSVAFDALRKVVVSNNVPIDVARFVTHLKSNDYDLYRKVISSASLEADTLREVVVANELFREPRMTTIAINNTKEFNININNSYQNTIFFDMRINL